MEGEGKRERDGEGVREERDTKRRGVGVERGERGEGEREM